MKRIVLINSSVSAVPEKDNTLYEENPIGFFCEKSILADSENFEVVIKPSAAVLFAEFDLAIAMAYNSPEDIVEMNYLNEIFYEQFENAPNTKFIFLSWFHSFYQVEYYRNLFYKDEEKSGKYELMNVERCHILQLPVTAETLLSSIKKLLQLPNHE